MPDQTTSPTKPVSPPAPEDAWMRTTCFSTSVRRIDRVLTRFYDDALRPSGLTTGQYSLLSTLGRAPEAIPLSQLAEGIDLDRSTLSRNLAPLERDGFVQIAEGVDRRARCVTITPRGRDKLDATRPLWRAAQDRVETLTGDARIERLLSELADLVSPIRHDPERV